MRPLTPSRCVRYSVSVPQGSRQANRRRSLVDPTRQSSEVKMSDGIKCFAEIHSIDEVAGEQPRHFVEKRDDSCGSGSCGSKGVLVRERKRWRGKLGRFCSRVV